MGYAVSRIFHPSRNEVRFPTNFRAILHWDGSFASVRVADIASHGFRVIGDSLPALDACVRIGATGLNEEARVVWRTDKACGLMLEHSVDALQIIRRNSYSNGGQRFGRDLQLGHIRRNVLAERLLEIFKDDESALAFLRGNPRQSATERHA